MAQVPFQLRNMVPDEVADHLNYLANYEAKGAVDAMMARQRETRGFTSDSAAFLAGISMEPKALEDLNDTIDRVVRSNNPPRFLTVVDEVVIGAGLHAAIYCAVRRKMGHPRPMVIEQENRIGGTFAMTKGPAFFLNSRNRPGGLGVPGQGRGLNVIPGAPIQPCDLSTAEYQRNNDLAFAIRMTLLMHSHPVVGSRVSSAFSGRVVLDGSESIYCNRWVDARGLGSPKAARESQCDGKRIMSYNQFMQHMDSERFPLAGMRNVAVVGAGDSGKTVVEALVGQGPSQNWSVAALDWLDSITWYGSAMMPTGEEWKECNRSRYQGLARFFPRTPGGIAKIVPQVETPRSFTVGMDCAYVNDRPFDCVILCTGYAGSTGLNSDSESLIEKGGRTVGRYYGEGKTMQLQIGPRARIGFNGYEQDSFAAIKENEVALWRLADRTAMLAMSLP